MKEDAIQESIVPAGRGRDSMEAFFKPKTVALIGASDTPGSVGAALTNNLARVGDNFFPVNPRRATVAGRPCLGSILDVPAQVDLVVIATPAPTVPGVVRDCVIAGARAAIIISSGFGEAGAAGLELERQVRAEAARGGLRLLGPNCLGVLAPHAGLNATFASHQVASGKVALISQSGALCTAILDWSLRERVGFSAFVSVGSMVDVGWGELLDWFAKDPLTQSILIYMESIGDARGFLEAARRVTRVKPIVALKVGRTQQAARAAASHTGALAGDDEVLDAAFRSAGVLRVERIEELFDMAEVLSKQPLPRGPRLAVVTNAGGPGALAIDALVAGGGSVAELAPPTLDRLGEILPPHWSHGNPVDVLGDANANRFGSAVRAVARDPGVEGLLAILTPQAMTDPCACAAALVEATKDLAIPVMASWMGGDDMETALRVLNGAGIATFEYPDSAARAFALLWQREEALRLIQGATEEIESDARRAGREKARQVIEQAAARGVTVLSKTACNQVLDAYDLPRLPTVVAHTIDEAVKGAVALGYPVVMKLLSATITHKTEVGGVKLGLRDELAVREAWRQIQAGVAAADFSGVTLEPMVAVEEGYQLILGSRRDAQFGPVMLFGAGGILVEVLRDFQLCLPPLNTALARAAIERTRIAVALTGFRGRESVDLTQLERILIRFSHMVSDLPGIEAVEINPLLATARAITALDVRILLEGHQPASLPAIR
jgi:acetyltransferase